MPLLLFIVFALLNCQGFSAQSLTMHPDKRLKAVIACDAMNRLMVANDRITQLFGDNEAYEVQSEENTGQVFLKPTAENGKKPLSVTLITENGLTQDLSLQPVEREATTIILKSPPNFAMGDMPQATLGSLRSTPGFSGTQGLMPYAPTQTPSTSMGSNYGTSLGWQDQVMAAMKSLVLGLAPVLDLTDAVEGIKRYGPQGTEISLLEIFNLGNFKGLKLNIKNTSDRDQELLEKDFWQQTDLALALEKRILPAGTSTLLYVVVR